MSYVAVAGEKDVAPGTVKVVEADGKSLCLGHCEDGTWGAIDNVCTHDGGVLGEGELEDCQVECPRHGARFELATGRVTALPAVFGVNTYPVRIVDGQVMVDVGVATKELEIG
ncbi:MAG TPA: Rieske 2Fe-2S domain-containing protein [Candidatus Limnocylindrales bacterium]|nr:Rieske 2Fe-2S domain-containing protein [Candidatus Limnocylindrales bacterium]